MSTTGIRRDYMQSIRVWRSKTGMPFWYWTCWCCERTGRAGGWSGAMRGATRHARQWHSEAAS